MKTLRLFVVIILAVLCGRTVRADTATITILHSFGSDGFSTNGTLGSLDGANPLQPPIIGTDGNFYGTTYSGGTNNDGTVYKMTPEGTLTVLYSFQGYDGYGPRGQLLETNGLFYGTTQQGGANLTVQDLTCCGSVFTITSEGTLTTLYSFGGSDGRTSDSGLIPGGDGNFYGTTYGGGTGSPDTATNFLDSLDDAVENPPGTIYTITLSGQLTTLHDFSGTDGANPSKEAVVGTDGNIYGTTLFGGANNSGTVYTITSQGTFTLLYSFTGGNDGAHPKCEMVEGVDGNYYGTTLDGGGSAGKKWCPGNGCGTMFKITPQGTLTTLHAFNGDPEPAHPGTLIMGTDSNFYGTSFTGGTNHAGTLYMVTPEGVVTVLHQFDYTDGAMPEGSLIQASDGSFYGTTYGGGQYDQGTIFQAVIDTNASSDCTFTLSATSVTLPAKGGSKNVSVKAVGTDCSWSAVSTDAFITITSGASGTGSGKVVYSVPGNTNTTALTGAIIIGGQTFSVNQAAGGCAYKLSPKVGKFKSTGGTGTLKVTPGLSDCAWTAVSTDSFITITAGTNGVGKGTVTYTVPANATSNVLTGSITVAGQTFTVTEAAPK